jgi:hypothetical protein
MEYEQYELSSLAPIRRADTRVKNCPYGHSVATLLNPHVVTFSYKCSLTVVSRAMVQAVSRHSVTAEARVRAWVSPCGICGGKSGTGTGFSPSSSVLPCQYIIPSLLSKLI